MKIDRLLLLLFIALLFTSGTGHAGQFLVTPRLSIGGEYYDQEYETGESPKEFDYITTVSPGLSLEFREKSYGGTLDYDLGLAYYDRQSENDNTRHEGRLNLWTDLSRQTRLTFRDSYLETEDPRTLRDIDRNLPEEEQIDPVDGTQRRGRDSYTQNTAVLDLTHRFAKSSSVSFGYEYSFLENDDPEEDDNRRHSPSADLTWWMTSRWGVTASLSHTKGEFDDAEDQTQWDGSLKVMRKVSNKLDLFAQYKHTMVDYDGEEEDYQIYDPSLGFDYRFDQDTAMSLAVGYYYQDYDTRDGDTPDDEGTEDDGGISVDADITRVWSYPRGAVQINGRAGYENASYGSENLGFDIYYSVGCSGTYGITRNLSASASLDWRYDKYNNPVDGQDLGVPADGQEREDQSLRGDVGLNYSVLRWLHAGLNYSYETLASDDKENEFDESRISFTVSMIPSTPMKFGE